MINIPENKNTFCGTSEGVFIAKYSENEKGGN
jgi:hypothetical protein